jgi:hypothetical protein
MRVISAAARCAVCTVCMFVAACSPGSGRRASSAAPAPSGDSVRTLVRVSFGEAFSPNVGPEAVKAFVPDVAASEAGGECATRPLPMGSKATSVIAYFPGRTLPVMTVSLVFDSVNHLVQYSEARGVTGLRNIPAGTSSVARDSMLKAVHDATRTTHISLNYALGQGTARNFGGGKPDNAVLGTVREVESLPALGPVKDRLARIRKLCGV